MTTGAGGGGVTGSGVAVAGLPTGTPSTVLIGGGSAGTTIGAGGGIVNVGEGSAGLHTPASAVACSEHAVGSGCVAVRSNAVWHMALENAIGKNRDSSAAAAAQHARILGGAYIRKCLHQDGGAQSDRLLLKDLENREPFSNCSSTRYIRQACMHAINWNALQRKPTASILLSGWELAIVGWPLLAPLGCSRQNGFCGTHQRAAKGSSITIGSQPLPTTSQCANQAQVHICSAVASHLDHRRHIAGPDRSRFKHELRDGHSHQTQPDEGGRRTDASLAYSFRSSRGENGGDLGHVEAKGVFTCSTASARYADGNAGSKHLGDGLHAVQASSSHGSCQLCTLIKTCSICRWTSSCLRSRCRQHLCRYRGFEPR